MLGLHVSPDLDSILYALAGVADEERGWGRADETWNALETAAELGGEAWFRLGDRDIGLHLVRTQLLRAGVPLSEVTARLAPRSASACALLPATDDPLRTFLETPAGTFPFQDLVRRPRPPRRGRRGPLHRRARARPAPGVLEAIDDADVIVHRAEQPVRLDRADPRRRGDPRRARAAARAVRRRQPADRRPRGQGPRRPDARAARRRHLARARRRLLPGLIDALVIDEADAPAELPGGVRAVVTRTLMSDDDGAPPARARRARRGRRARVRVAILGGTGSFGRALAARLVAAGEDEVVIGSRDAARAQAAAAELGGGARARRTRTRCAASTSPCSRSRPTRALDTAREVADALGATPLLSVASTLRVLEGRRAARPRRALARRADPGARRRARSSPACTRSRRRTSTTGPPDEDALVCGDDAGAKELALELAAKVVAGRALDAGPLASARTLEGLTAVIVNLNRRYKGARRDPRHRHLRRVISILPVEGLPEIRGGRRPRRADRGRGPSSRTATSSSSRRRRCRRRRGGSCGSTTSRPRRARASSPGRDATCAQLEVDPRRDGRGSSARAAAVVIAETRHGFVCASAGVDHSNAPEPGTRGPAARSTRTRARGGSATRCVERTGATSP